MNISIEIKERDTDHIDIFVAGEIDAYTAPKVKEALEEYIKLKRVLYFGSI